MESGVTEGEVGVTWPLEPGPSPFLSPSYLIVSSIYVNFLAVYIDGRDN